MKQTCELNGNLRLRLEPQNDVEAVFLQAMAASSANGAQVKIHAPNAEEGQREFSVEVSL